MTHFDLPTLYFLAIGTLLLSAGLTLWERQTTPQRSRELRLLATGYAALAGGCGLATIRSELFDPVGAALSNLVMVAGYLLILEGIAAFGGRSHRRLSIGILAALALGWAIGGERWQAGMWSYAGGVPIALACGLAAWEMLRSAPLRALRSRRVVVLVTAGHALFYAGRACILPLLVDAYGPGMLSVLAKATMYEGVLFSVALPMALLALIREEAHDRLLAASRTDFLTGLGSRQWFFEEGERRIEARGAARPISLLAFDLDHFKTINDRYGHATGDEVLKLFARTAQRATGPEALLARIGGEEFVALLPGYSRIHAREVGRALAARFAATVAQDPLCRGVEATVSIGLAELGVDGAELNALLSAADRALYLAKARGRNRIEMAAPIEFAVC